MEDSQNGGCSQVVRHQIVTLTFAGSSPVSRPKGGYAKPRSVPPVGTKPVPEPWWFVGSHRRSSRGKNPGRGGTAEVPNVRVENLTLTVRWSPNVSVGRIGLIV